FTKLLEFVKKGKHGNLYLLFIKWDRFSRNSADAYIMLRKLNEFGVEPRAIEQPLDMDIPENKIMLAIYIAAPEVENERRSLNTIRGMRRAMKEGRWCRNAPIGYLNARDEFNKPIIIPGPKARIIQKLFLEYANGGKSLADLIRIAAKEKTNISRSNMSRLIRNKVYIGKFIIPVYKDEEEQCVEGLHEAIVEESLFYQVQEMLDNSKRSQNPQSMDSKNDDLPMRGHIKCSHCGRKLTGSASKGNGGKYLYYHCNYCGKDRIRADHAETEFSSFLTSIKPNPAVKKLYQEILKELSKGDQKKRQTYKKAMSQKIEDFLDKIKKAQDLLLEGELNPKDYHIMK
ncbi:recombinase family protein, partial [bacterium]|nr:recombinase family protein [bacterium]